MAQPATGPDLFGRAPLYCAAALGLLALGVAATTRLGADRAPPAPPEAAAPLAARDLLFEDLPGGGVGVRDAGRGGAMVAELAPGTNGFVRATLRGLARERRRDDLAGPEAPFRVAEWPGGRVTLQDTATGRTLDLAAFGHTQVETFQGLLHAGEGTR